MIHDESAFNFVRKLTEKKSQIFSFSELQTGAMMITIMAMVTVMAGRMTTIPTI